MKHNIGPLAMMGLLTMLQIRLGVWSLFSIDQEICVLEQIVCE